MGLVTARGGNHRMSDPLPYREPDVKDVAAERLRRGARQAMLIGAIVFVASAVVVFSPFVLGHNPFNKYIVAFALIGVCGGVSLMLHGAVDWLRTKE